MSIGADIGLGLTKGAAQVQDYSRNHAEREAARAEAYQRKAVAEAGTIDTLSRAEVRESAIERDLANTKREATNAWQNLLESQTYRAFDLYDGDGDVRHLDNFLRRAKETPIGSEMYANIATMRPINNDEWTAQQLRQYGIQDPSIVFEDDNLKKEFVEAISPDGTRTLIGMSKLYESTRYFDYVDNRKLQQLTAQAEYQKLIFGAENAETALIRRVAKENNWSLQQATEWFYKNRDAKKMTGSALERITQQIYEEAEASGMPITMDEAMREARLRMTQMGSERERLAGKTRNLTGGTPQDELGKWEYELDESQRTTAERDVRAANRTYAALDALAGENKTFFDADLNDPRTRIQAGKHIAALEKFTGKELTTEDKRVIRDVRKLASLGGAAGSELSAEATGLVDTMLADVRKYISDNVEETAGTSAYSTFSNIFRNGLYGATLTNQEAAMFTQAAGSLKEQLGPTLQKLLVQLGTIRDDLQAVYDLNDEYVAYYYLGKSREDVDDIIRALDERVKLIKTRVTTSVNGPGAKRYSTKPKAPGSEVTNQPNSLDSLYDATMGGE